ncbi:MAG: septal ring lytic transglycosylase RlpA family protein [Candidatus Aminicenantales bacterium]
MAGPLAFAAVLIALPPRTSSSPVEISSGTFFVRSTPLPAPAVRLVPTPAPTWVVERGIASWYGDRFQGRKTASGEIFDKNAWVMATRHLPLGVRARVRYKDRECIVRVIDRGPYISGRIYDVSEAVAHYLGFHDQGLAEVEVSVLRDPPPAKGNPISRGKCLVFVNAP